MYLLLLLLFISNVLHADISKLQLIPSGIKVKFDVPPLIEEKEAPPQKKLSRWAARKAKKEAEKKQQQQEEVPIPQLVRFTRFIRVINAVTLNAEEYLTIDFYDNNNKLISQQIITNTPKPSPNNIFYMDRNTGRRFQGFIDHYHIPKNTSYFQIGIYNKNKELIYYAEHPDFTKKTQIPITQYNALGSKKAVMFQIEVLGQSDKTLTRIGAFYFPK
ncbi:MAG: hypothetical protein ACRCWI_08770 [Brevinema sp.]